MDYHTKYNNLKRKLKTLLYVEITCDIARLQEQESFQNELEKSQLKLIRVSRDKSFLLDRLLLYENISGDSSNDSDATLSSDNETEPPLKKKPNVSVENTVLPPVKAEVADVKPVTAIKSEADVSALEDKPSEVVVKQEVDENAMLLSAGQESI